MFGSIEAVPAEFEYIGSIVDVYDMMDGVSSYMFDGIRWNPYIRR